MLGPCSAVRKIRVLASTCCATFFNVITATLNMNRNMAAIPIAKNMRPSYENFVADCPWCGYECIFNRASDLHTFEPIGGLNVTCLNGLCAKTFRLVSDSVNERHEMLIYDCYELLVRIPGHRGH